MVADKGIVIADTNVISYAFKNQPISRDYERLIAGYELRISFITAGELHAWAETNGWGNRRRVQLKVFLIECPVIPYSIGMEKVYGRIVAERRRSGHGIDSADAWIATTALYHDVPLVTNDVNFLHTRGLRVITASAEARATQGRLPIIMRSRPGMPLDMQCRCGL